MTATALGQWHLTVWGAPRTKKTHNRVVRVGKRTVVLPSKQWEDWAKKAVIQPHHVTSCGLAVTPTTHLNLRAHFYRDADRGDLFGYLQGVADLLEKQGVVFNDAQFKQCDGSRLFVDRVHPRVEITLEELPHE